MNQAVPQAPLFTQGALDVHSKAETEAVQSLGSPSDETPTGKKSKKKKNKRRGSKNANGNESAGPPTPVEEEVAVQAENRGDNIAETEELTVDVPVNKVLVEAAAVEATVPVSEEAATAVVVETESVEEIVEAAATESAATVTVKETETTTVKETETATVTETVMETETDTGTTSVETVTETTVESTMNVEVVATTTVSSGLSESIGESGAVLESSQEVSSVPSQSASSLAKTVDMDTTTPTMNLDSPKKTNNDLATLLDLPSPVAATTVNGSGPLSPTLAFLDEPSSDVASNIVPASIPHDISELFGSPMRKPASEAASFEINSLPDPFASESIPSLKKPLNPEALDDPFAEESTGNSIPSASVMDESAAISHVSASNVAASALFTSTLSPVVAAVGAPVELSTILPAVELTEAALADNDSFQLVPPPAQVEEATAIISSTAIVESVEAQEAVTVQASVGFAESVVEQEAAPAQMPEVEPAAALSEDAVVSEDKHDDVSMDSIVPAHAAETPKETDGEDAPLGPSADVIDSEDAMAKQEHEEELSNAPDNGDLVDSSSVEEMVQIEDDALPSIAHTGELSESVHQSTAETADDNESPDLTEATAGASPMDDSSLEESVVESAEVTLAVTMAPSPSSPCSQSVSESEDEPAPSSPSSGNPPPAPVVAKAPTPEKSATSTTAKRTNGVTAPVKSRLMTGKTAASTRSTTPAVPNPPVPSKRPTNAAGATTARATTAAPVRSRPAPLQRSLSATASTAAKQASTKTPPKVPSPASRTPPSVSPRPPARSPSAPSDSDVKAPKKKLSASEIEAAGNRLYEQAMESKRRLEAKKAQLNDAFTFAPQVNAKSKKVDTTDAPDRFSLLHERAKEAQRKKEELRERLEKEQCTFKPQITTKAKKISSTTDRPRYENLYKNAQEIQAKREERKKLEAEKKEEELTFKPKIKTTKSPVRSRPLYDPEVVKQKRLELEQKKLEAEQQAKPKTVKKTKPDGDSKIFDRLYQAGQQRAERIAKLKQEREEAEKAQATFQPKLSTATNARSSKQPFHQRLYDKDYLKKVAAEREQKKLEEEKQRFSFKPRVSDKPDSVKSKGSSEGGSTSKSSIFERLYSDKDRVKEKIEMSEELKIQKEMEECTFRPHIDVPAGAGSKGESSTPIWERLLSVDKNQVVEERERLKAQQEMEACTFRPEISPTPGSASPRRVSSIFERLSSTSAGGASADDQKRRMSVNKQGLIGNGKRNSYSERVSPKLSRTSPEKQTLSVGDILKSSKLALEDKDATFREDVVASNGGQSGASLTRLNEAQVEDALNVVRSLEKEFSEGSEDSQPKSITENYDSWAASLEEKMRNL